MSVEKLVEHFSALEDLRCAGSFAFSAYSVRKSGANSLRLEQSCFICHKQKTYASTKPFL
jgi:hypothetical protein